MPEIRETYNAVVARNEDPEMRGRVQVKCAGLTADPTIILDYWAEPDFDWGWFYVPDVGELIEISVLAHDDYMEAPGQAYIEFFDMRWRTKRKKNLAGDAPRPPDFMFGTNYGKRRGFYTPTGHVLMFDDTKGDEKVTLAWKINKDATGATADKTEAQSTAYLTMDSDGSIQLVSKDGNMVYMNAKNGSITLASSTSSVLVMDEDGIFAADNSSNIAKMSSSGIDLISSKSVNVIAPENITIESGSDGAGASEVKIDIKGNGDVELTASGKLDVTVEGDDGVKVDVTNDVELSCVNCDIKATGDYTLGDGADSPLVRWNELNTWITSHTHPTAFGPSGPAIPVGVEADIPSKKGSLK